MKHHPKFDSQRPKLTAEHRQRIADGMRRAWPERRKNMPENFGRPKGATKW
jgi:hypothetical protein